METHYEKDAKEQTIKQYQPEASIPLAYKSELSRQEKDSILKEVYSTIQLFYNLIYEAKKKSLSQ